MSFEKKTWLLVASSTAFGLLICEAGLRLFTDFGANAFQSAVAKSDQPPGAAEAMHYVEQFPAAPGTDRQWFKEDPPPLSNRSPVSIERVERHRDYERRGIFALQADYVWNRYYVESQRCSSNGIFRNFPDDVLVFNPPSESVHPRYRFPPNVTTSSGLVTNQFGLRGPPVSLERPPNTIRIAFIGASTTVGSHNFAFSYPERVVHWLNRFAAVNGFDVHFEGLNAGREGLNSEDIAAIVKDELLSLDPDLAVYYEGSNQFAAATYLVSPRIPPRNDIDPRDPIVEHKVPAFVRTHFATGDLLDRALNGFRSVGEPVKPAYRLNLPPGVNERNPDVDNPNLPLQLPVIVKDLDSIRASLSSIGAELVLCSFEWLVRENMPLSPTRQQHIYRQLNTGLWPLRYADIRRLADFQNRVFRGYAAARRVAFLDVASAIPQDPGLFEDAIHMTEAGDRIRAWIVFQQLVPLIRRQIESGRLPHPHAAGLPPPPSLATSEMPVRCIDIPTGPLERVEAGASIATVEPAYNGGSVQYGRPVSVTTGTQQWSYAASFALNVPPKLSRPCYVFLRARVVGGHIGLAVHDRKTNDLQLEKAVEPSSEPVDIYVPVLFPDTADSLVIRNIAADGRPAQILIEDIGLLAFLKPTPEQVIESIPLSRVQEGDKTAALQQTKEGLVVITGTGLGAFAGRFGLAFDGNAGVDAKIYVSIRVLEGNIGVGILTPDSQKFVVERPVWPSSHAVEIALPLPSTRPTGDLIIRNLAGGKVSHAIIEKVEIRSLL